MCLYPKLVRNKKYVPNKSNKGIVPLMGDNRVEFIPVGCGKCYLCMRKKARNWQVRLNEEIKDNRNGKFVVLTFSNESLMRLYNEFKEILKNDDIQENIIATIAVRRFLERWRKKYKISVRHWLITELGHKGTERIHLHGIIFSDEVEDIKKIWQYGNVFIGDFVNEKSIGYIVKYVTKMDLDHKGYIPKILCSKGIGSNYMLRGSSLRNQFNGIDTKDNYISGNGAKLALPTYYRNKIYNDSERELLFIDKINKGVRYIDGIEVKEKDEILLYRILEQKRLDNIKLGYGDDSKEWNKDEYIRKVNFLKKYKK